jgi:hypothetical protein
MARTSKFTAKDRLEILTLKMQGQTAKAIGERYGVSHTTVNNQLTDLEHEVAKSAPFVSKYIENLQIIIGGKIAIVLDQITPDKAAEANISQLATVANLLNNMRRLESGESTTSHEVKYSRVDLSEYQKEPTPAKLVKVSG